MDANKFLLEETTYKQTAKDDPKDKIEVEIGDSKQPDFKPQLKIMRWDNEVNFSIRAEEDPTAAVELVDEKIKYKSKAYEVHLYDKPEAGEDGGFEFEWLLNKKPKSNVLTATIQTKGLDFLYQPELTPEEIEQGSERPENVIGSYAVYHSTKKNNIVGGKNYATGKAFHIFRPKAVDAENNAVWCNLNVDAENGLLTVEVPQDFLNKAVYPVIVDPTFGYTSIGASSVSIGNGDSSNGAGGKFTLTSGEIVSKITTYSKHDSPYTGTVISKFFTGTTVPTTQQGSNSSASATITSTPAWVDASFSGGSLLAAGDYWVVSMWNSSNQPTYGYAIYMYYDSSGTGAYYNDMGVWGDNTNKYSIYATYGSGVSISRTANPAGVSSVSNVATYSGVSIGDPSPDRTIVVTVASELTSASINSVTLGGVAMNAGTQGNQGAVYARTFYLKVPIGTTADIVVTYGANASSTQNHIAVYKVNKATYISTGADQSTDMDATDPLTTGSTTISAGGGMIAVAGGATDTVAKAWAGIGEDLDIDAGNFRFTTAFSTTHSTATRTCTGTTNGEDGALSWLIFAENVPPVTVLNSPADAAEITDTTPTLDFTGTDTESDSIRYQIQISPKNFDDIVLDTADGDSGSSVTSKTNSVVVASGNNRKMVVTVANNDSANISRPPSSVTYDGVALTLIADIDNGAVDGNNVSIWELAAPNVGTANLVVSSAGTFSFVDVGWAVYQNASQNASTADGMTVLNVQNPTVYIPCPLPGSWAVSIGYPENSAAGGTITGATEFMGTYFPDAGYSGPADSGAITHQYAGAAATEDWTFAWVAILPAYADGLIQGISGNNDDYSDNFDDNSLAAMWTSYTANSGAVAETSGQLSLTCANTTNGSWAGIYSDNPIDLRGSSIEMEIVDGTGGNTYLDLTLCAETLPNTNRYFISIGVDTGLGNLQAYKKFGGTIDTIMADEVFNATNHKYVRMREHAGIVYWEYSADSSTWAELWSEPAPVDMSSLYLVVDDYEYNNGASPGAHIVDNLIMEVWEASAFVNPDTGADTDPFNSGENIQYTVQTALSLGTYYWRVGEIDPSGSNTYGAWTTARSFDLIASGTTTRRYSLTTLSVG